MTINYRDTLNLPETDLSMKAGLANKEPEIINLWNSLDLYNEIRARAVGKDQFILHDGPPYANGDIHIGHSVNKILKDITIKIQTMLGKDAPFIPGWDCHGLPIELNVEKKHGKNSDLVKNKHDFINACKEYALTQVEKQKDDFIRLGVLADWSNPYKSADASFEADTLRALATIVKNNHLQKGEKPVHFCQDCGSALAEAEVEYQDKVSKSIDVSFQVSSNSLKKINSIFNLDIDKNCSFVIWTTTPWTLPSNVAVCINPKLDYSVVKKDDDYLIIATELIDSCSDRWNIELKNLSNVKGSDLKDIDLEHPFLDRQSILLQGSHVTTDAGTGCVHTAPAHGLDDYFICKDNNIEPIKALNNKGFFKDEYENLAGLPAFKADPFVIEILVSSQSLINVESYEHSYPHCWRHKTPLIFTSTPQWFISMDKADLLNDAKASIDSVNWEPSWGLQRIKSMLEDRPDWCISRQRNWGVPIALVVHKDSGDIHPNQDNLFNIFADLIEESGVAVWDSVKLSDYIDDADNYIKITDTLDVWFDSGATHFSVLEKRFQKGLIADLYLEGSDQHRGWFQSSLLTSIAINGRPPYKEVLTHGFVVDDKGRKQSKSLGNVVSPQKVWNSLGADILRLWVAATDFRSEMNASDEILKRVSDQYRRIRNTFRFLLGNLNDFDIKKNGVDFDKLIELDKWILNSTLQLQIEVQDHFKKYQYHTAVQKIHNFCVNELGGIFLDIVKDRLYTTSTDSHARRSCQTSMYYIVSILVRLVSPILSFTAEEIWQTYSPLKKQQKSVFLSQFINDINFADQQITNSEWSKLFEIKDLVNQAIEKARNDGLVKGSLDTSVEIICPEDTYNILQNFGEELHFVFISSYCQIKQGEILSINISQSNDDKCARCWHRSETVGKSINHPELCSRCEDNIENTGEVRKFV